MNAIGGILRATLRPRGTRVWWAFFALTFGASLLMLVAPSAAGLDRVAMLIGALGSFMGWCVFLPRLWQLQRHAEALQLPAARRAHRRAIIVLAALGCALPAGVQAFAGASLLLATMHQVAALAAALLYLLLTPLLGALLLGGVFLLVWTLDRWQSLAQLGNVELSGLMALATLIVFAFGSRRWRAAMSIDASAGWSTPQMVALAQDVTDVFAGIEQQRSNDWPWAAHGRIDASGGPRRPLRALAVLLCGPLAPQPLPAHLVSTGWMLIPVLFFGAMTLSADPQAKGPLLALIALFALWSLGVPLTILMRLRREWQDGGQSLAEAALLPALQRSHGAWPQAMLAVLFAAGHRLWLPGGAALAILLYRGDVMPGGATALLIACWGGLLLVGLLPLAQRAGASAAALLFVLCGGVAIAVLLSIRAVVLHDMIGLALTVGAVSLLVGVASLLAMHWPRRNHPFVAC